MAQLFSLGGIAHVTQYEYHHIKYTKQPVADSFLGGDAACLFGSSLPAVCSQDAFDFATGTILEHYGAL